MTNMPDEIWTCSHLGEYGRYYPEAVEAEGEHGGAAVKYIRADHVDALLKAEREKALQEARILAAIEPAPVSVREAARVLYDMPETDRMKAWRATRDAPPEFAKWFCVALRAIAEGKDDE